MSATEALTKFQGRLGGDDRVPSQARLSVSAFIRCAFAGCAPTPFRIAICDPVGTQAYPPHAPLVHALNNEVTDGLAQFRALKFGVVGRSQGG
jgi:hypothetical protein